MSITLNDSDFQCLQDQLVDLKTKNYELAEKNRRSQADFEAAKAKICSLQLKLEEQERDFQVTSTTLRREIENVSSTRDIPCDDSKEEDYRCKYKKLLHKAKELQQRYEKSVEVVQQLDGQNRELNEKLHSLEGEHEKLRDELSAKIEELKIYKDDYEEKLKDAIENYKISTGNEYQKCTESLLAVTNERDTIKKQIEEHAALLEQTKQRLESESEERKIQERKGVQIVKELKRQLAIEKNRTETLQKRIEVLITSAPSAIEQDVEERSRLSTSSSTNGNSSSIGNGSRANQDSNSVGSWSFVPIKSASNSGVNETLSVCSIGSEDRETVQQPCDTKSEDSMQLVASPDSSPNQNLSDNCSTSSNRKERTSMTSRNEQPRYQLGRHASRNVPGDGMLIEEQAALMERLTNLQHDKWMLEEKLAFMESANTSLSEDLANKSDIIRNYFMEQANKALSAHNESNFIYNPSHTSRRTSFQGNINNLLSEKVSIKKVVDFLKERSQLPSVESETISREATKKMQLMLEETLIKCIKLQENLDYVTSELNKLKS